MDAEVGIVVPTLGTRPDYLHETLRSIRASGSAHITLVCPRDAKLTNLIDSGLVDEIVPDPGDGLPSAINTGINALPSSCRYVNWIGDDDLLEQGALGSMVDALRLPGTAFVWGRCRYIDGDGRQIWVNKSGAWALSLMRIGPNLVPQPGSLFSRTAFNRVGGLNTRYGWAFDQDLFIRLSRVGLGRFVPTVAASFRWHEGSLSAGSRAGSVRESSEIRMHNYPTYLRPIGKIWEVFVRFAVSRAGIRMNRKS